LVRVGWKPVDGEKKVGIELKVEGIVQGVGFRPFIFHLAKNNNLKGWVRNESDAVFMALEGTSEQVDAFFKHLQQNPPPLSRIDNITAKPVSCRDYEEFVIDLSISKRDKGSMVPPDIATCSECLEDTMNPFDRHYRYPFTNCTNCGPRFTIVKGLPYDRASTSMQCFSPCVECSAEYGEPANRRFHAQPIACPSCGPQVQVFDQHGVPVADNSGWLKFFWDRIDAGDLFAVKSLGGYNLACRADKAVIAKLRERKIRPLKPFALMCRDLGALSKYCRISRHEAKWLASPAAPIILLPVNKDCSLPDNISPGLSTVGIMLPYTPLHHMIMQGSEDIIVMTSANPSGLPMIKDDDEALARMRDTADYFLIHNRDIIQRCDDSVARVFGSRLQLHRRSRGFTPKPVELNFDSEAVILGAGSEMKNTFCLLKGNQAFLSQHLGEIDTMEAEEAYLNSLYHYNNTFKFKIDMIAYDMHPEYRVSSLAREVAAGKYFGVYHHHAHFASCLAENGHSGRAIGIILDGTGYGDDGAVWGFEVITGDYLDFTRELFQRYISLPGGDSAIRWPWRMAMSYLWQAMGKEGFQIGRELFEECFPKQCLPVISQLENGLPAMLTSSCGRLFDAVSSVLGLCYENTYEGQAAVELSDLLEHEDYSLPLNPYPFIIKNKQVDFCPLFPELLSDIKSGREKTFLAKRFHDTVVQALIDTVQIVSGNSLIDTIALSGGTWLNPYLLKKTCYELEKLKFKVLLHEKVPPNDGGLSLGQAAVAYWRWKEGVPGNTDGC